jgi:addiction module HigA family antidote
MSGRRRRAPVHPGEILRHEFLDERGITPYRLAMDIGVPANRITGIVNGTRAISAETALRLGRYFAVAPEIWLNLQLDYDLEIARRRHGARIAKIMPCSRRVA